MKKLILIAIVAFFSSCLFGQINPTAQASGWALNGSTVGSEKTFGTVDNFALPFIVNNTEKAKLSTGGIFSIYNSAIIGSSGSSPAVSSLFVAGSTNNNTAYSAYFTNLGNNPILSLRGDRTIGINANPDNDIVLDLNNPNALLVPIRVRKSDGTALFAVFESGYTNINNELFVGGYFINPSATLQVKGIDATSSNYVFKTQDASDVNLFSVRNDGIITTKIPPLYADNAAALAGGLTAGMVYCTNVGGDYINKTVH